MPKKQKDNRYRAKITVGYDADGVAVYKYVSARTKKELEEAKVAARKYYVDGEEQQKNRLFGEYAREWYKAKKEPTISPSSKASYNTYLEKHIIPAFGDRMLRAIQPLELQQWLNQFDGKSKSFITAIVTILKGVFSTAAAEGIIARDVSLALSRPKATPPAEKRAFTKDENRAIERAILSHEYGSLLAVLYYTGMRRGEALGLKWGDFDWDQNLIHLERDIDYTGGNKGREDQDLKTKAAYRDVPLLAELKAVLYPHRGLPYMFLFGTKANTPLSYVTFLRRWMSLMIECGFAEPIEHEKKESEKKERRDVRLDWKSEITPHMFRHNFATRLYEAGVDPIIAARVIGHSDYSTTVKIYTHLTKAHLEGVAEKIGQQFRDEKVAEKLPAPIIDI